MPDLKPAFTTDLLAGLRLNVPPVTVGEAEAVDLLDVDWDTRGVLGSRMGAEKLTTKDPGENYNVIFGAGTYFVPLGELYALLARRGELLVVLNEAGEEIGGKTLAVSTGRLNFCQMGSERLTPLTYIANQNEPVRKFDGENFSSPEAVVDGKEEGLAMPRGHFVADWQDAGNRLCVANTTLEGAPGGAGGSPSHVFFSEPGQPEHYESTAYVQLNPGDGEQIIGMVAWGTMLFVFKETHLFVFTGVSADEEGRPIFNFTTVDLGTHAIPPRGQGSPHVVAGREGVYFIAEDGIWVTTGGRPVLVSDGLELSQDRREQRTELGGMAFPTWRNARGIAYLDDCLYVGICEEPGEGAIPVKRMFKLDLFSGHGATYWTTDLLGFTVWAHSWEGKPRLHFSGAGDNEGIYYYTPETDEDPTVEMDPYWLSGAYDLGDADEKTLTVMKLWGSGDVDVSVAEDYLAVGATKTCALGAGDAIAQFQLQRGQTATILQHKLSGAAPWSVQRLTRYLQSSRVAATEDAR